jgi:deoxyribodipyrimidine photolyase
MTHTDRGKDTLTALPPHLRERARLLKSAPVAPGRFVLYWMHHAVRGHENPALDCAVHWGNTLGLPVLVYQGLGGRHRFNNDRHHQFILEGARDAHREIAARGVRAVFHLPLDGSRPSPLRELLTQAAVAIFEDYPAPPFPTWSETLAASANCPVVSVDGHCVVPMQKQPKRFDRAFEFRRHNQADFEQRVPLEWHDIAVEQSPYAGALPFEPLDLDGVDLPELIAQCPIDHSVPPVADTRGGSVAGYQRWKRFRREGLTRYADLRNDAAIDWPRGVSRLSPYLHHGHVSPLRIAREAAMTGGKGANKFLDELLIWRELRSISAGTPATRSHSIACRSGPKTRSPSMPTTPDPSDR